MPDEKSDRAAPKYVPGPGRTFGDLMEIVRVLRDPGGCPWDLEQTHQSLRRYLLEEAYETLEAIEKGDALMLREELGDLLTHIAFHADIAKRTGEWDEADMFGDIVAKLVRRHPHVFGEGQERLETARDVEGKWEQIKRGESGRDSLLGGVPDVMPALAFAAALQRRAAKAGIVWDGEEEFEASCEGSEERAGAYLWGVVARLQAAGVDPETVLRAAAVRFRDRVRAAEAESGGVSFAELPDADKRRLWEAAGGLHGLKNAGHS